MSKTITIDRVLLRMPNGWQGDATQLARAVAQQLQVQAHLLTDAKEIKWGLQGHFAGDCRRVTAQLATRLGNRTNPSPEGEGK
ncbi:MAG: hypothetical protein KDI63_15640 [Gammaproteobacteria bacterium]|nr:hypothetical protein [Gammaproteobacteria bacterium]